MKEIYITIGSDTNASKRLMMIATYQSWMTQTNIMKDKKKVDLSTKIYFYKMQLPLLCLGVHRKREYNKRKRKLHDQRKLCMVAIEVGGKQKYKVTL